MAENCAVLFQFSIRRVCNQCCHSVRRDLRIWTFAGESKPRSTWVSSLQVHLHTPPDRLRAFGRGNSTCYLSEVIVNHDHQCCIFDLLIKSKLCAKYIVVHCVGIIHGHFLLFCSIVVWLVRCFVVPLVYVSTFFCRHWNTLKSCLELSCKRQEFTLRLSWGRCTICRTVYVCAILRYFWWTKRRKWLGSSSSGSVFREFKKS